MISTRKGGGENKKRQGPTKVYDFRPLSLYIMGKGYENSKVLHSWAAGCNSENIELAIYEAEATQMLNTRSKNKTYHLVISFRPEDEGKLTEEVLKDIELNFAQALGFENHQRVCGVHVDTANMHMHVAYNKIDPEKFTSLAPSHDYRKRDEVCRAMEQKYGLKIDLGKDDKDREPQSAGSKTMEKRSGLESLESYAKRHAQEMKQYLDKASSWQEAHQAFGRFGLVIKPSGNGFAIHDKYGKHKVKASNVERTFSKKYLSEKFGEFQAPAVIEVTEIEKYEPRPVQPKSTARDTLFADYKAKIGRKYEHLKEINEQSKARIEAIEAEYDRACGELIFKQMLSKDRQRLTKQFRTEQKMEIRAERAAANEQREALNTETPFSNWLEYLQHEARSGNTAALLTLRSSNKPLKDNQSKENNKMVQAAKNELLDDIQQQQLEVLAQDGLLNKDRNKILNMLKLQEYAVYENDIAAILDLPFEVDGKGTVIYTLPNGGKVRDDSQQVHFSAHDSNALKLKAFVDTIEARKQQQKQLVKPKEKELQPDKPKAISR